MRISESASRDEKSTWLDDGRVTDKKEGHWDLINGYREETCALRNDRQMKVGL